jgi:uncharacterized phosphosugar-binding protein
MSERGTVPDAATAYLSEIVAILDRIASSQQEGIATAAELLANTVTGGGVIHVVGPGHSHVVAEEAFNRTGGLACVNPIVDRTGGRAETVDGYARAILDAHELRAGETMIISSNSGINPLPVEMAMGAKDAGLQVVAITSLAFSQSLNPRHSSGKKLFELADVALDNHCPPLDALVDIPGVSVRVGPSSTIGAVALLNATMAATIERIAASGGEPPVLLSERQPGEYEANLALKHRYGDRVRAQNTAMLFY